MGWNNTMEEQPLKNRVVEVLQNVACCDLRLGVAKLGLVQDVSVDADSGVSVKVLPCCIFGMTRLVTSVKESLGSIEGITNVEVDVAWDQVWRRDSITPQAQGPLQFNLKALAKKHGLKSWASSQQKP